MPRENGRSEDILVNVVTGDRERGTTSTNLIDSEWGRMEEHIPRSISGRTEAKRIILDEYIRAAQWCRMHSTGDRWAAWCRAAQDWILEQQNAKADLVATLHPIAFSRGARPDKDATQVPAESCENQGMDAIFDRLDIGELALLEKACAKRRKVIHQTAKTTNLPTGSPTDGSASAPSSAAQSQTKSQPPDAPSVKPSVKSQAGAAGADPLSRASVSDHAGADAALPRGSYVEVAQRIEDMLPGQLKGTLGVIFTSALSERGFAHSVGIAWEGWALLCEELLVISTNPLCSDEDVLQATHTALGKVIHAFLRIAADNVHDIPAVADAVAKRRYTQLGYVFGEGMLHGENDCLPDSLIQCMSAKNILPARLCGNDGIHERGIVCKSFRAELSKHHDARLRPVPWNCFLGESIHGPPALEFLLRHFRKELLCKPLELVLVTHSRFDSCVQDPGHPSVISPATTRILVQGLHEDPCLHEESIVELHTYNDTGRGHGGLHFSPVLKLPELDAAAVDLAPTDWAADV